MAANLVYPDKKVMAICGDGGFMINEHTAFRVDWMPFAGLKQSGLGVGGIPYTMRDMQIEKLMVLRSKEL